jgi:hypothetical protein
MSTSSKKQLSKSEIEELETKVGYKVQITGDGLVVFKKDGSPAKKKENRTAAEVMASTNDLALRKLIAEGKVPADRIAALVAEFGH